MVKNENIDVRAYYRKLSRKERGMLQRFLLIRYSYSPRTIGYKLNKDDALLRRDEKENIQKVIASGEWRQQED